MNRKLVMFCVLLLMIGCSVDFDGIVVCKEYIPAHMDNESPKVTQEASIVIPAHPIVVPHRHRPIKIKSQFIVYAGNKYGVVKFNVDSVVYIKTKIGQRWSVHNK